MDTVKFSQLMYGLAENFSAKLTAQGMKLRYEVLSDYTYDQVEKASIQILKTRKYTTMPTVADFIEAIEGTADDKSEIQAGQVVKAIGYYGSYQQPTFNDPVTKEIMKTINWGNLCAMSQKDLDFKMKEFRQLYKSYKKTSHNDLIEAPEYFKKLANSSTKAII